ncbi:MULTISPECIES: hypothetical protein [unclassified Campylobacter]|uniref:hypothetical protein n=1 Tax=unclassified Campylobacter TaxID=2593542 RepID=UPI0022E99BF3|nr:MULTISPECIES: hypothetical protein [unclassified Campylobacter]MDA3085033.1 hypothetical protein [Campylobacter sp. CS_ED1]MDA3089809.1 hypothetical protein [Campylobacter sp. CS_ED2]
MENLQNKNESQRDYDKKPIVINDYSRLFAFVFNIVMFVSTLIGAICLMIYKNKFGMYIAGIYILIMCLIFLGIGISNFRKFYLNPNFKFTLLNDKILESKNPEIEINLTKEVFVGLTYIAMDDKNSKFTGSFLSVVVFPINIFIIQPILIISKILFHFIRDGEFWLFDSFIVIDNDGKFINIMATNIKEFDDLKKYFKQKFGIDEFSNYYFFNYSYKFKE